ncbi:hypothetical protein [Haliea sp. E17]|uniref:hypothetical protein n=1 Tax=Haliea sp. E17 TaxID=3401576 RepID=UPI003AB106B7
MGKIIRISAVMVFTLVHVACSEVHPEFDIFKHRVTLEMRPSPLLCQCPQDENFAAFLKNAGDRDRLVHWSKTTATGQESSEFSETIRLKSGEIAFLGCSVESPSSCNSLSTFQIKQVYPPSQPTYANNLMVGGSAHARILECMESCKGFDGCLPLRNSHWRIVAPINRLFSEAQQENSRSIEKQKILAAYGIEERLDRCNRSDLFLAENGEFSNSGDHQEWCELSAFEDLAQKLELDSESVTELSNLRIVLPPKLLGSTSISSLGLGNVADFEITSFQDDSHSSYILFTGEGSDNLNREYGGSIQHAAKLENKIYLATSNGCLSIPVTN